jgi:2-methylisocitrate lyase-like PEP mutase family enzyme
LQAYAEAGADVLMPMYPTRDWLVRFGKRLPRPIMPVSGFAVRRSHSDGDDENVMSSEMTASELAEYNVKIVVYPTSIFSRIYTVVQEEFSKWLEEGIFVPSEKDHDARKASSTLIGVEKKKDLLRKFES